MQQKWLNSDSIHGQGYKSTHGKELRNQTWEMGEGKRALEKRHHAKVWLFMHPVIEKQTGKASHLDVFSQSGTKQV